MNINQIITMIVQRLLGQAIARGVTALSNAGKRGGQMAGDTAHTRQGKQAIRKMRQAARLARRIGRF